MRCIAERSGRIPDPSPPFSLKLAAITSLTTRYVVISTCIELAFQRYLAANMFLRLWYSLTVIAWMAVTSLSISTYLFVFAAVLAVCVRRFVRLRRLAAPGVVLWRLGLGT